jgi:hypothetical protein
MRFWNSLLFSIVFIFGYAQVNVLEFVALAHTNDVLLSWSIGPGNTCSDLIVQRGTDSTNYTTVYSYPGICGDGSSIRRYNWQDENAVCGLTNYYRLVSQSGGILVTAEVLPLCLSEQGYRIWFDAGKAVLTFQLDIIKSPIWKVAIYDGSGRQRINEQLTATTNELPLTFAQPNIIYIVLQTADEKTYSEKLLILR